MKKMIKILALVCVFAALSVCFVGCGEEAANTNVIKFGTNAEFPPFEFVKGDGSFDGIDIQIANLIAADNGMTPEIVNMEFDSLLVALENGQVDAVIAGMSPTAEREEQIDFTNVYYSSNLVIIYKKK